MRNNYYSESGFSLIELLVVVSIISILVSISVVAFDEAKFKAYQAGGKHMLGVAATNEQAHFEEFRAYTGRMDRLGMNMTGTLNYDLGFHLAVNEDSWYTNGQVPPPSNDGCLRLCWGKSSCVDNASRNYTCAYPACGHLSSSTSLTNISQNAFRIQIHAHYGARSCSYTAPLKRGDTWMIDQNKRVTMGSN